jgi:hypothetical protein
MEYFGYFGCRTMYFDGCQGRKNIEAGISKYLGWRSGATRNAGAKNGDDVRGDS